MSGLFRRVVGLIGLGVLVVLVGCPGERVEAGAGALGPSVAGEGSADATDTLEYFLARNPDPVRGPVAPRPAAGWIREEIETLSGGRLWVERASRPSLRIGFREIRSLQIRERMPAAHLGEAKAYYSVELEVDGRRREDLLRLRTDHPGAFLMLRGEKAGGSARHRATKDRREGARNTASSERRLERPATRLVELLPIEVALVPGPSGSPRIAGGSFATRAEASDFYADLRMPVEFIALSAAEREAARATSQALIDLAVWTAECDPIALEPLGDGLAAALETLPDIEARRRRVDCASPPPAAEGEALRGPP